MKKNYRDFLPAVLEVQETPPSPLGRLLLWVIMVLFVIVVCWSSLSKVDIVATTRGKLVVNELSRPVNTSVTAEIVAVLVKEGQHVEKGQPLIKLNSKSLLAQLEENLLQQQINRFHIARLTLLYEHYLNRPAAMTLPTELQTESPILAKQISMLLQAEVEDDYKEKEVFKLNQQVLMAQIENYQAQKEMAENLLPIYEEQHQALDVLYKKNMTSKDSLLEVKKKYLEAKFTVSAAEAKVKEMRASYAQIDTQIKSHIADKIKEVEQEKIQKLNQNHLLSVQQKQLEALIEQYELKAPIAGIVESLAYRDAGAAVEAPQELLKIVPENEKLIAEVLVSNQDIGFLRKNQSVTVKIDTFDFTRYGWIEGKLLTISSDAIEDKDLGLVYKAVIELSKNHLIIDDQAVNLEPGMSISAEIITGQRTLLSYLLSPMMEALDDVGKQR
ncbi:MULTISPECIES: HlyD family type I secretion periplasmic adaptor subunit [unclassified Gilliamella]|uniref:HlyD family type I secretion periplasmic adaptor subunit n=1 Tax=unclassified Gilliamella TaxID=2685620 RepID=UPI00130A0FC6|nr:MULTISPECIES: HlyD family type I secretion periplasmic adaptor subunit [unclassified Gilliamella]MWP49897.1 HlyD family type I secretion periplasmic adaptor subunit [Gilliamella sp. Lep-s35]MWP68533.1 HlyD family type I secretion periplasmic adaptor subunit [Gilliamella sp. Lep-s5]MWP77932.1 HlyD family type I secretion periplasmic adaptor subunit [Gilliamella sp. Lep-s21]